MTDLFVFDTNSVVSALLFPDSKPAQAIQKAQVSGFLICSNETYAELREVLLCPKFDRYLSPQSRQQFLVDYRNAVLMVDVSCVITDCRDAKDNKFLEVAVIADVTYLISGDDDLLVLHPYCDVQILTPAAFLLM